MKLLLFCVLSTQLVPASSNWPTLGHWVPQTGWWHLRESLFKKGQKYWTGRRGGNWGQGSGRFDGRSGTSWRDCSPWRTIAGAEEKSWEEGFPLWKDSHLIATRHRNHCVLIPPPMLFAATLESLSVTYSDNMGGGDMSGVKWAWEWNWAWGRGKKGNLNVCLYFQIPNSVFKNLY